MTRNKSNTSNSGTARLSLEEITELMQDYDLVVDGAEEQGEGLWRLVTDRGIHCLHLVKFSEARLAFINAVMEHLASQGLKNCVRMIRNKHGQAFSFLEDQRGFYLTDWLPGRPCSFSRTDQVQEIARLLARIHNAAVGLNYAKGSAWVEGWGDWPKKFSYRLQVLQELGAELQAKHHPTKTEKLFLDNLPYYLAQGQQALALVNSVEYQELVAQEQTQNCFCLRDIGSRTFLRHDGSVKINGFDYSICDLRVYDLARLLRKFCTSSHWDWTKALSILQEYENLRPLSTAEKKVLLGLLTFPRKYWLYAKKYFSNNKALQEGVADRLKRAMRSEGSRVEFLNRLQEYALLE